MPTTEQIESLTVGMTEAEITSAIGAPNAILKPGDTLTSTEAFRELGSAFQFPDRDLDAVWTYGHPVRRKLTFCLGLKDGRLTTKWRLTGA
jgi:hypothetical protein